ncbi:hypothetical protein PsYK624_093070 [Phanerochaete sordida]|uniref:Uncharacterized protein n=1 Tax=Phanerochaete sordida TaxID=48140 RepID=A0A9P3LFX4_9APHY|nr:hypothetical protein PsYK624_093070 [Phanerochaete sordida]
MKYFAVVAALAASALAQTIAIASPAANSTVYPGQWLTVEVDKPNSLSASIEVALVLSMAPCPPAGCTDPSYDPAARLGAILYNGPFSPVLHPEASGRPPYEDFSVQVPSAFVVGEQVALIATHAAMIGAGPEPFMETKFVPLTVVSGP